MDDVDSRRLVGQVLAGRYRLDELVGEGGMGAVYRAEHVAMRKRVAVKVLHATMLGNAEAVARFEREAIAGAHVDHPSVAAARDFGRLDDGSHFLVLDYLEGADLRSVIARGALDPERATRVTRQIALGLRAVHQLGIVHRDLKPENVMLIAREGEVEAVKVLDFGIAKVPVDELATRGPRAVSLTQSGVAYGTPEYMAPEQALAGDVDGRADLYALGVMLYEMLSGRRPFDAADRSVLLAMVTSQDPPPLGPRVAGGLPPALEALVMRLLRKDPRERFADAGEVVEALDRIALPEGGAGASPLSTAATHFGAAAPRADQATRIARPIASPAPARTSVPGRVSAAPEPRSPSGAPIADLVASLPPPLRRMPAPALLSWVGLGATTLLVVLAVALRSPKTLDALEEAPSGSPQGRETSSGPGADPSAPASPDAPAAARTAPPDELDAARAGGLAALGSLAQRFPSDPAVLKSLLLAHAADKAGYSAAVGVARRLFEVAPSYVGDDDVRRVLLLAVNSAPEVSAQAFEVIAGKMGTAGPDLLYEFVTAPNVGKLAKDRAQKLLDEAVTAKTATPALSVAVALRGSLPCARKTLLPRAKEDGDARALGYLKPLLATTGCGIFRRGDCYACFADRGELRDAVSAIEARAAKR